MKLFSGYLRHKLRAAAVFFCFSAVFLLSFFLCGIPLAPVLYPAGRCALLGGIVLVCGFFREKKRHRALECIRSHADALSLPLPPSDTIVEDDYRGIVLRLCEQQRELCHENAQRYNSMMEYYTVWAHQIKTPISAMRLNLQNEDSEFSRMLSSDLFRIEQYSEMVMAFLRLDSDSTDYVIRKHPIDPIVRQSLRKFAGEFIARKLRLEYSPPDFSAVTDEKWLAFVIEQLLSNALKYTRSGCISVYSEAPSVLCIRDTGIGIAPEDLPRIFENGFTGQNGREDKKASGLGLWLCRRVCLRLGHGLSAESVPGKGTVMRLNLAQKESVFD